MGADSPRLRKFLQAALGEEALQALEQGLAREPKLAKAMPQRAVLSWVLQAMKYSYDGPVPGQDELWLSLSKSGATLSTDDEEVDLGQDLYKVAAALALTLELEPEPQQLATKAAQRLGKSLDQLVGMRLVRVETEMEQGLRKAISLIPPGKPAGPDTHDYSHVLSPDLRSKGYELQVQHNPATGGLHARALHRGNVVGEVQGNHEGPKLDIQDASVHDQHRGQGLGLHLYEGLMAHAHHNGATHVEGGIHSSSAGKLHQALARKHGLGYNQTPTPFPHLKSPEPGDYDGAHGPYDYAIKKEPSPLSKAGLPPPPPDPGPSAAHHVLWDQLQQEGWHRKEIISGPLFNRTGKPDSIQLLNPKFFNAQGYSLPGVQAEHGELQYVMTHGPGAYNWKGQPAFYTYQVGQTRDPQQLPYATLDHRDAEFNPETRRAFEPKVEPQVNGAAAPTLSKGWPKDEQENTENANAHAVLQDALLERGAQPVPGNVVPIPMPHNLRQKASQKRAWAALDAGRSQDRNARWSGGHGPFSGSPSVEVPWPQENTPRPNTEDGNWDYDPDVGPLDGHRQARVNDREFWADMGQYAHNQAHPIPELRLGPTVYSFVHVQGQPGSYGRPQEPHMHVEVMARDANDPPDRYYHPMGHWSPKTGEASWEHWADPMQPETDQALRQHLHQYFQKNPIAKSALEKKTGPTFPKLGFGDDRRETVIADTPRQKQMMTAVQAQSIRNLVKDPQESVRQGVDPNISTQAVDQHFRERGFTGRGALGSVAVGPNPGPHAIGPGMRRTQYMSLNPNLQDENESLNDPNAVRPVQLHENLHGLFGRVSAKHGAQARDALGRNLWAWVTYRAPKAAHAVQEALKRFYDFSGHEASGKAPFEEFLATTLNIANSKSDRADLNFKLGLDEQQGRQLHQAFNTVHRHMGEGGKMADERWLSPHTFAQFLRNHTRTAAPEHQSRQDQQGTLEFMTGMSPRERKATAAAMAPPKKHFLDDMPVRKAWPKDEKENQANAAAGAVAEDSLLDQGMTRSVQVPPFQSMNEKAMEIYRSPVPGGGSAEARNANRDQNHAILNGNGYIMRGNEEDTIDLGSFASEVNSNVHPEPPGLVTDRQGRTQSYRFEYDSQGERPRLLAYGPAVDRSVRNWEPVGAWELGQGEDPVAVPYEGGPLPSPELHQHVVNHYRGKNNLFKGWPRSEKQNQENRAGFVRESPPTEDRLMEQGLETKTQHTASEPSWMDYGAASPEEKDAWPRSGTGQNKLVLPPANPAAQLSNVSISQDPRAAAPINGGTPAGAAIWEAEEANQAQDVNEVSNMMDISADHRFAPPTQTPSHTSGNSRFWDKIWRHVLNDKPRVIRNGGAHVQVQKLPAKIATNMARAVHENEHHPSVPFDPKAPRDPSGRVIKKAWPKDEAENSTNAATHQVLNDSLMERGAQEMDPQQVADLANKNASVTTQEHWMDSRRGRAADEARTANFEQDFGPGGPGIAGLPPHEDEPSLRGRRSFPKKPGPNTGLIGHDDYEEAEGADWSFWHRLGQAVGLKKGWPKDEAENQANRAGFPGSPEHSVMEDELVEQGAKVQAPGSAQTLRIGPLTDKKNRPQTKNPQAGRIRIARAAEQIGTEGIDYGAEPMGLEPADGMPWAHRTIGNGVAPENPEDPSSPFVPVGPVQSGFYTPPQGLEFTEPRPVDRNFVVNPERDQKGVYDYSHLLHPDLAAGGQKLVVRHTPSEYDDYMDAEIQDAGGNTVSRGWTYPHSKPRADDPAIEAALKNHSAWVNANAPRRRAERNDRNFWGLISQAAGIKKVELPGQTHQPKKQLEPAGFMEPEFQPQNGLQLQAQRGKKPTEG